jgi:superfamily II DNA or RNA helicase
VGPRFLLVTTKRLRPYQTEAIEAGWEAIQRVRAALVVMPTATGKTVVFCEWIRKAHAQDWNVLVLTHREEILEQAVTRLFDDTGIRSRIEKAERVADPARAGVVAASVQTLSQPQRLGRWAHGHFDLIVIDESHHASSETWKRVVDHFDTARVLGVTATPERADCKSLLEIFENIAYEMSIRDAIDQGFLVPIRQRFVRVEGLDYTKVRVVARDLHQGDLGVVLENAEILRLMAEPTIEIMESRPTIVFAVSVATAHAWAKTLEAMGASARALDGTTPRDERRAALEAFRRGEFQYLVNVGLFGEGVDLPNASGIVMGRPTMSRVLYTQQLGRGLRVLPDVIDRLMPTSREDQAAWIRKGWIANSPKQDCVVLDFVGNSQHKLIHTTHIIEPQADDRVTARAEELIEAKPSLTTDQAVQLAFEQIAEEDTRTLLEARAAEAEKRQVAYQIEEVDPFGATDTAHWLRLFGIRAQADMWDRPATEKQISALRNLGIEEPDRLSMIDAKRLQARLIARRKVGKATIRQMRALIRAGTLPENALRMSFERASRGMQELKDNDWRRPAHWGPRPD